jgi:predicted metal-dependent hydrolase
MGFCGSSPAKTSTWRSAYRLLFARDGLLRGNVALWRDYLRPDFHPSQHDASQSQRWLRENSALYAVVGQPG